MSVQQSYSTLQGGLALKVASCDFQLEKTEKLSLLLSLFLTQAMRSVSQSIVLCLAQDGTQKSMEGGVQDDLFSSLG